MSKDNGGPAFPAAENWRLDSGMTLRDYFAAKAMQAFCVDEHPMKTAEVIAG